MKEYSAAHSTDTTWFAIDKCGHLAVFHSGEEGAVADGSDDIYQVLDGERLVSGELAWAIKNHRLELGQHSARPNLLRIGEVTKQHMFGFFVLGPAAEAWAIQHQITPDHLKDQSRDGEHLEIGALDSYVWAYGAIALKDHAWLHADPERCLGCSDQRPVGIEARTEMYGIFEFNCSEYGTVPYERSCVPTDPKTLDEIQKLVPKLPQAPPKFSQFCFMDKETLQPPDWLPSSTYGEDGWVREDGVKVDSEGVPKPDQKSD